MIRLALAYMRDRPLGVALNALLLGIAVATLVLLLQFAEQAGERFERDARGIDLVVGAKGSPLQLVLSSVYHIDVPTGNIPLGELERLRDDPGVAQVVPLALGDNFQGFRIVGSDDRLLPLYGARVAQGRSFARPAEAVLGAEVARRTGARLGQKFIGSHGLVTGEEDGQGHDHAPFETVGILAPSGTVLDRLILTSVESVWDVHGIEHEDHDEAGHDHDEKHVGHDHDAESAQHDEHHEDAAMPGIEPEITALLVRYRNASAAMRLPSQINRQSALQAAAPAAEAARLLGLFGSIIEGARLFGWLLALSAGLSLFVALWNATRAREGDLALLRVMGARPSTVFGTILIEGLLIAAIGALGGIAAAHGLIALASASFPTLDELGLSAMRFLPGEGVILIAALAIGLVAALIPAIRIFRVDLATTLARYS
ncbi:MAG: ABC transporter permease [Blastomonas sp.]|jgi:putative ABC transport system permease protein|uniref:ABC transporter permease n=1 Tax=Blastomonas sp. TaxID=1909299 RepID=UPI0008CA3ED9|nr:ABC transporter permease [Blastomonas sp.]MCH2238042.1 ABC transporter permease [Blastomonas sp.]OHD02582.1 MAG: ABC transporter permease [Sphingopyxis sp. RIFCSPHIGHO2_01_FULL_65_24]